MALLGLSEDDTVPAAAVVERAAELRDERAEKIIKALSIMVGNEVMRGLRPLAQFLARRL